MNKNLFEKYKFRKYKFQYSKLYDSEKTKLKKILGKNIDIEHIGSTAVKGLGGKGIIDILIGVPKKNLIKIKNKLLKYNYHQPGGGSKSRIFLEKDYKYARKVRRVHIQLVPKNSKEWKIPINARNILRKNKKLAQEYSNLKKKASKQAKGIGKIYRDTKKKFLDGLLK